MKIISLLSSLVICAFSFGQNSINKAVISEHALVGEWLIDLRPTPDSEPYYQVFAVESATDSSLDGSFYGSALEDGYVNAVWPELHFAFTTRDANHAYYHTGYLKEGKLFGTSYCPGRNFIARWTGERKE